LVVRAVVPAAARGPSDVLPPVNRRVRAMRQPPSSCRVDTDGQWVRYDAGSLRKLRV
jgi:hypothetical protein